MLGFCENQDVQNKQQNMEYIFLFFEDTSYIFTSLVLQFLVLNKNCLPTYDLMTFKAQTHYY